MAIVSAMGVSQTVSVSQTMSVSQTVSVSESVSISVVRISLRFSLSLPLVQSGDVLEGVTTRMELTDSICGVSYRTEVSVSVVRLSLRTPLTNGMDNRDNRIGTT